MTCIVGVAQKGSVWIGGDSASGLPSQYRVHSERTAKVFRVNGMILGFTTSWRMGQLLRFALKLPADKYTDPHEYLATAFVDAVRTCLKAGGVARKVNEVEEGCEFIVGYRRRLFAIREDYAVSAPRESYVAVGCGVEYALGVLHATKKLAPAARIHSALSAAAYHSAYVRSPFVVLHG